MITWHEICQPMIAIWNGPQYYSNVVLVLRNFGGVRFGLRLKWAIDVGFARLFWLAISIQPPVTPSALWVIILVRCTTKATQDGLMHDPFSVISPETRTPMTDLATAKYFQVWDPRSATRTGQSQQLKNPFCTYRSVSREFYYSKPEQ